MAIFSGPTLRHCEQLITKPTSQRTDSRLPSDEIRCTVQDTAAAAAALSCPRRSQFPHARRGLVAAGSHRVESRPFELLLFFLVCSLADLGRLQDLGSRRRRRRPHVRRRPPTPLPSVVPRAITDDMDTVLRQCEIELFFFVRLRLRASGY